MRILSIDYGKKRTGLAVTDHCRSLLMGWQLLLRPNFSNSAKPISRRSRWSASSSVSYPANGQPSENLARVENFFNRWRKAHPEVPIEYYDERFTSVLAHRAMIDGGVKKKTRRENKGLVDEISATIILQDFMQSRR